MSEHINVDELLSGYIDGELTQRQLTEVKRLVAHDEEIAERLRELKSCRTLLASMPSAEAPEGLLEDIKISLERNTLLNEGPEIFQEQQGVKDLMVRKVLAAAAMIGLVAVLAVTVYTIIAPQGGTAKRSTFEDWHQPVQEQLVETVEPVKVVAADTEKAAVPAALKELKLRIELKTAELVAVDGFISRAIEENGLLDKILPITGFEQGRHLIGCDKEGLSLLLADLKGIWGQLDSASLFVDSGADADEIIIEKVTAEQIGQVISQDSFEKSAEVAKDFAVLNSIAGLEPGKEILASVDSGTKTVLAIPKPVLTSNHKAAKETSGTEAKAQEIQLTIIINGL